MPRNLSGTSTERLVILLVALLIISAYWLVGSDYDGFALYRRTRFMLAARTGLVYTFILVTSLPLLYLGVRYAMTFPDRPLDDLYDLPTDGPLVPGDRLWLVASTLAALTLGLIARFWLLQESPIVDDEAAYRFSAQLLSQGHLSITSPPDKIFFDRQFMINDGQLYSQYFLGWPALLALGELAGAPGLVNPLLAALTVPPVFLWTLRTCGRGAARVAVVALCLSPMFVTASGTLMSHTACTCSLAWFIYLATRLASRPTAAGAALTAGAFCLAFFIRPSSALGLGLPWLILIAWRIVRPAPGRRFGVGAVGVLLGICAAAAGLFLLVNLQQNGSPWLTSYARAQQYAAENGYAFTTWNATDTRMDISLDFDLSQKIARHLLLLVLLNFTILGWPISLALVPFAWRSRGARLALWSVGTYVLLHFQLRDQGFDTVGVPHYFELLLPVVHATGAGAVALRRLLGALTPKGPRIVQGLVASLVLCGVVIYWPTQLITMRRMTEATGALPRAVDEVIGDQRALVFSPIPFGSPDCRKGYVHHVVFFRPNNDPGLQNRVLWVNTMERMEKNEAFAARFPGRRILVARWRAGTCKPTLLEMKRR